jgi:hypothetical protein
MSDKNATASRAALLAVANELAAADPTLVVDDSATAWTKVTGRSGNKVYFQKRDSVAQVHLSGWGKGRAGTVEPPKANGKVEAWLDLSVEDPVAAFRELLVDLAAQPAPTAKAKEAAAPKAPKAEKAPRKPKEESASAEQSRLDAIRARAKELGLGQDVELDSSGAAKDPQAFASAVDVVARDMQGADPVETDGRLAAELASTETVIEVEESDVEAADAEEIPSLDDLEPVADVSEPAEVSA